MPGVITTTDASSDRPRRHPWRLVAVAIAAVVVLLLLAIGSVTPFRSNSARLAVINSLSRQLDAEVQLDDLRFRLLPRLSVEGHGLHIRHHGRQDVPPLISVKRFTAAGGLLALLHRHVNSVVLEELDIEIPPDRNREPNGEVHDHAAAHAKDTDAAADAKDAGAPADTGAPAAETPSSSGGFRDVAKTFVIDELRSVDGRLVIMPGEAGKPSRVWQLHALRMTAVSLNKAMPFEATLTNAVPPGSILTSGSFGPWDSAEPRVTPLQGRFTFDNADLSVFKGISGILSARGSYGGTLARIDVNGETDTPDFTVTVGGHPLALHAAYHAVVDGTNGNTLLEQIDASFLKTSVTAKGAVAGKPGVDGRTVTLDVTFDHGRLEDVLQLAVNTTPAPMVGALTLTTKFRLPPGPQDVSKKLELDGKFTIDRARFSNREVQSRIEGLSQRTRGLAVNDTPEHVSSHFGGTFTLGQGVLKIPSVVFNVPGSLVKLSGTYGLSSERIDFSGTAYTDAKVSQMATGFKRWLLKPVDWFLFKRDDGASGAAIPIRISGTRNNPDFGLDKGRVFRRN